MTTTLSLRERLLGTWQLRSLEQRTADGTVDAPFGAHPRGLLIYAPSGQVAVQFCRADRPRFAAPIGPIGTPDEMALAYQSYASYFGTYTVDEAAATVTHHIEAGTFPNLVGANEVRAVDLQGDELTLRVQGSVLGERVGAVLVWRRVS